MARVVEIPYKPRNWARRFHRSLRRFSALVLHRRAGKTTCVVNHHLRAALDDDWERRRLLFLRPSLQESELKELINPPGGRHYGHVMPTRVQAKVVAWDKLKFYADQVGGRPNESELLYRLPNGNKIQLFGADDPDAMRGPAFSGLSFDEYSQQPRNIFSEVLSKALGDHLGYAVFLGTIKGKDHLYETHEAAKMEPEDWFALWQDIDASLATEEGITIQLLAQAMDDDRKMVAQGLMTQDEFDQEWYLSLESAIKGAFYGDEMRRLRETGHLTQVPHEPSLPVDTDWDLGIDAMAVWFSQRLTSGEIRIIDYYENVGGGLIDAIQALKGQQAGTEPKIEQANARRRTYVYGEHWGPHDIEVREITSGLTRRHSAKQLGVNFQVTPKISVDEGISAVKLLLPRCYFDAEACKDGIESLRHYRKTWQQRLEQYTAQPVHDKYSHGADAFRGLAVRYKKPKGAEQPKPDLRDFTYRMPDAREARIGDGKWMQ